jgi:DNA-binding NtrC family response regulator
MQTILVISKDWKFRTLVAAQLREEGYRTFLVKDVPDAFQTLKTHQAHPNMIILDTLPIDLDPATLDGLHLQGGDIPLLICAGGADSVDRSKPFCYFLQRPVSIAEIVEQVKKILCLDKPDTFLYNE